MPSGQIDIALGHKPYRLLASVAHFQHFTLPLGIQAVVAGNKRLLAEDGTVLTTEGGDPLDTEGI